MIKKLARYIQGYKKDSILTPIFVMLEVIMEVLIPFLMAERVRHWIPSTMYPTVEQFPNGATNMATGLTVS